MTQVELGLLGPLRVVVDGQALVLPGERLPVPAGGSKRSFANSTRQPQLS